MERLKDSYTPVEAMSALLHEREQWNNDLVCKNDYINRVLYILRFTKEED